MNISAVTEKAPNAFRDELVNMVVSYDEGGVPRRNLAGRICRICLYQGTQFSMRLFSVMTKEPQSEEAKRYLHCYVRQTE